MDNMEQLFPHEFYFFLAFKAFKCYLFSKKNYMFSLLIMVVQFGCLIIEMLIKLYITFNYIIKNYI